MENLKIMNSPFSNSSESTPDSLFTPGFEMPSEMANPQDETMNKIFYEFDRILNISLPEIYFFLRMMNIILN